MDNPSKVLEAIYSVGKRVAQLERKIDDSVNGHFKDNERRISNLEGNQRWVVFAAIGACSASVMASSHK